MKAFTCITISMFLMQSLKRANMLLSITQEDFIRPLITKLQIKYILQIYQKHLKLCTTSFWKKSCLDKRAYYISSIEFLKKTRKQGNLFFWNLSLF